jgi:hypothetical protein
VEGGRNGESALRWSRAQIFLLFNATLLTVGLPFALRGEVNIGNPELIMQLRKYYVCMIFSFGIVSSIVWIGINWRANQWLRFWSSKMTELEGYIPSSLDINQNMQQAVVRVFSSERYNELSRTKGEFGRSTRKNWISLRKIFPKTDASRLTRFLSLGVLRVIFGHSFHLFLMLLSSSFFCLWIVIIYIAYNRWDQIFSLPPDQTAFGRY